MTTCCEQNVAETLEILNSAACCSDWPYPQIPSKPQHHFSIDATLNLIYFFLASSIVLLEAKLVSRHLFFIYIKGRKCIYIALLVALRQVDTNVALPFSLWQPWALRFFIIICLVQVTNQALNRAWLVTWHCASQWRRRLLRSSFLSWQPHGNMETTKLICGRRSNTKWLWWKLCMWKRG